MSTYLLSNVMNYSLFAKVAIVQFSFISMPVSQSTFILVYKHLHN